MSVPKINSVKRLSERQRAYWVAVVETDGIGPYTFAALMKKFRSAEKIWKASDAELKQSGVNKKVLSSLIKRRSVTDPKTHLKSLEQMGITPVCLAEESYPSNLKSIKNPPAVLFVKGQLANADEKAIGVVGTRKPSSYGREVTEKLVAKLVVHGFTIVSGLARGIDGVAHRTALEHEGRTIAVLGGGPDQVYPAEHRGLAERIIRNGALISEFTPGFESKRGHFPARNRLISGLSLGVVVVEGMKSSGTKSTAIHAFEQKRKVFAVPGQITSPLSDAPMDLLNLGAKMIRGIDDVLEELKYEKLNIKDKTGKKAKSDSNISFDSEIERKIYSIMEKGQMEVDEIVRQSGFGVAEVSSTLTLMEVKKMVKHMGGGLYAIKA